MKAENGVFPGFEREEYDRSPRINFSKLKLFARSPAHYRHALLAKQEEKDTDAMKMGRAVHLAIFEPARFQDAVAVWDGGRRAGKEWDTFKAANQGRELLKSEEYEQVLEMQTAARADPGAAKYLAGGAAELTVLWTHVVKQIAEAPGYTAQMKGRLDFVADIGAIVDLKTGRDISEEKFAKQAWELHYAAQAAMYVDGYKAVTGRELPYVIFALENKAPYVPQVYRVERARLKEGRELYRDWLDRLNHCRLTNRYPGYWDGELELGLPRWALGADEDLSDLDLEFNAAARE
jgi:hypothetical protein